MDKNMEISESEKKALEVMENPRKVNKKDVEDLQGESLQNCRILDEVSSLLDEESVASLLDVDKELKHFHEKHPQSELHHFQLIRWGVAIAAIAALFIGAIFLFDMIKLPERNVHRVLSMTDKVSIVMDVDSSPQEVTLEVENEQCQHYTYSLDAIDKTPEVGATTVSTKEISYFDENKEIKNKEQNKPNTQTHILSIPRGQMFKLVLSDGTEVFLNAGSRLSYPTNFVRNERIVTLEGEAYFKVAKDRNRPFIVKAGAVQTRVLGTEFNISCYSASDIHVTLIEGSVQVDASGASQIIEPGQDLCVRKNGSMKLEKVDLHSYMYWRDGYFYFDNLPLVDVLKSIGRWYNVGVEFRNTQVMDCEVHFLSDRMQGLEHTLTLLNRMEKASIYLEGNTLIVE